MQNLNSELLNRLNKTIENAEKNIEAFKKLIDSNDKSNLNNLQHYTISMYNECKYIQITRLFCNKLDIILQTQSENNLEFYIMYLINSENQRFIDLLLSGNNKDIEAYHQFNKVLNNIIK